MSTLPAELAKTLEAEGVKTVQFFESLAPEQWDTPVYSEGPGWRVQNLLAHFTEVEGSISELIRSIVGGGSGVSEDFDIDRWNAKHTGEISQQDKDWLLAEFVRRRRTTVEMVTTLTDADLEKRGRHPALGITEVKNMVKLMYIHILGHQRDIKRALKKP
ncbi:MAG TPA: DinB family protein [Anaerolineales bacterium]|jgi:hypothetical protein|nr:DinB family protein [Anaerolineales bacterium]